MADIIYKKCKTEGCEKQVKQPFWYCFDCNTKRKEQKAQHNDEGPQPNVKVEFVKNEPVQVYPKSYNEGAEFGLACNLGLRKTLAHWDKDGGQLFEETYKHNVKMLFRWNKELRQELIQ